MHKHLTQNQRIELSLCLRLGYSLRKTATTIGVHVSTVSREIRRNSNNTKVNTSYHAGTANYRNRLRRAEANGLRIKLLNDTAIREIVEAKLRVNWSPEQISGWLRRNKPSLYVCPQTIYDWIYRFRRDLKQHLHCRKGKYRRTRAGTLRKAFRHKKKQERSIDKRPKHIEARNTYGHWEGDTVVGSGHSGYIATFVERKSGYLLATKLTSKEAKDFEMGASRCFSVTPEKYNKTLTLDNGTEMSNFEEIERSTGLDVYFAHPYHSWERGTNENTNGLLRFYFPKKASFKNLTQEMLDQAVRELNTRPRKRLDFRTPEEVFTRNW